jgi:hypothetical protein
MPKDGHTLVSRQANKSDQPDEYTNFETALKKVLSVPHSALKAELDREKRVRKQRQKRASGHASRAKG